MDLTQNWNASRIELFSVSRFSVGQKFNWHKDWISPDTLSSGSDWWARFGQRVSTVQIYLSDVERGGDTVFSTVYTADGQRLRMHPRRGDAIFFFNVKPTSSTSKPDEFIEDDRMVYAEEEVLAGEKWSINVWTRGPVEWMREKKGLWNEAQ